MSDYKCPKCNVTDMEGWFKGGGGIMKIYRVWNELDPNDNFEVEATTSSDAAFKALEELGWLVGEGHDSEDEDTDEEATA